MNAPFAKKMIVLAAVMPGLALTACAGAVNDGVEAPLEPRIAALVAENRDYPRWEDFPAMSPAPEPVEVAARVNTLRVSGAGLEGEASRIEWTLSDSEAFAREIAARVAATPVSPDARATQADIDAFAQRLRDRGRAPPPVPRR
ncbi:MAG: hypothetical protein V4707_04940 [Pseudomonadota bacterium]